MAINTQAELRNTINELQQQSKFEEGLIKENFKNFTDTLKPASLIKSAFKSVVHSSNLADNAMGATLGLGAGVLSKKLLIGSSAGIVKRLLGTFIEIAVAKKVANNSEGISHWGVEMIKKIVKKRIAS